MKLLALVSGGKDSIYSIYKAVSHGHEVVAVAHVSPPTDIVESDSMMYQSIGSQMVPVIAKCLRLPFYTRSFTKDTSFNQDLNYRPTQGDEVEILFDLISHVKTEVPDIQGILSGAILSDYQRNRVENVCSRLSLFSFAYLWQRKQSDLLHEMVHVGQIHAVLVKVAGMGLTERALGKSLFELESKLLALESTYGTHVCGEGGEYETLVLDMPLFHDRIVLDRTEAITLSKDDYAPVAVLSIHEYHLEAKNPADILEMTSLIKNASSYSWSDSEFFLPDSDSPSTLVVLPQSLSSWNLASKPLLQMQTRGLYSYLVCHGSCAEPDDEAQVFASTISMLNSVLEALRAHSMTSNDIFYCNLYLAGMKWFAVVNRAYSQVLSICSQAPSRACIQIPLPLHVIASVDVACISNVPKRRFMSVLCRNGVRHASDHIVKPRPSKSWCIFVALSPWIQRIQKFPMG